MSPTTCIIFLPWTLFWLYSKAFALTKAWISRCKSIQVSPVTFHEAMNDNDASQICSKIKECQCHKQADPQNVIPNTDFGYIVILYSHIKIE